MAEQNKQPNSQMNEFTRAASGKRASFFGEYIYLLKNNKKWWMLPLLIILLGFGALMILGSTGAAPFIYTLF